MTIYYFDLRDGNAFVIDEVGMELHDMQSAQGTLAGVAWDAMRVDGAQGQQMIIDVRDAHGPVMEVKFSFESNAGFFAERFFAPAQRLLPLTPTISYKVYRVSQSAGQKCLGQF
ncbi:hypothetical protein [Bradyrhizobium sp. CCBAU 051011]|uniref:DUF6894 family protein n=1 Tax=Bradyrhizobium sp. CCBAU 051011 TaxID=858422 RepID=UPI00192A555E|nr:hypothetical protein [Bradyrhizobium sp. CCBAU 051011]